MVEPLTLTISELAARWDRTPRQIVEFAAFHAVPVLVAFRGIAVPYGDRWHRANGSAEECRELARLDESIARNEAHLRRNVDWVLGRRTPGEWDDVLGPEEVKSTRRAIERDIAERQRLNDLLEKREDTRRKLWRNGFMRVPPLTLQTVADCGRAPFPDVAFDAAAPVFRVKLPDTGTEHLDGALFFLERSEDTTRSELSFDSLQIAMDVVKALESARASPNPSPEKSAAREDTGFAGPKDFEVVAQSIGAEYMERHIAANLFPSQRDVAGYVEKTLREQGFVGAHGKPVGANYIRRNALQGEWWRSWGKRRAVVQSKS